MSRLKASEKVNYNIGGTTFTIDRKYTDLKLIGKGSYGVVCSALDISDEKKVAIKKISPMAKHADDAKLVLREVRLMRLLGGHLNIISMLDLIVRDASDEMYIVMELLDSDLHRVIQGNQVLTDEHIRYFTYQLLCGVKYMHDNRIIHRDLKPGNLLVTRDCQLRITDFGLARQKASAIEEGDEQLDSPMTEHVVTRWYRPPELMLCPDGLYSYSIDLWSCGCILAELIGRTPLFPGKNFVHQLSLIFDIIGFPSLDEVKHIKNSQAKKFLDTQVNKPGVSLSSIYPKASTPAISLLSGLLQFDPNKRLTSDESLNSEYLIKLKAQSPSSYVFPPTATDTEFEFEYKKSTRSELRDMILREVVIRSEKQRLLSGIALPTSTPNTNNSNNNSNHSNNSNSVTQKSSANVGRGANKAAILSNSNNVDKFNNNVSNNINNNRNNSNNNISNSNNNNSNRNNRNNSNSSNYGNVNMHSEDNMMKKSPSIDKSKNSHLLENEAYRDLYGHSDDDNSDNIHNDDTPSEVELNRYHKKIVVKGASSDGERRGVDSSSTTKESNNNNYHYSNSNNKGSRQPMAGEEDTIEDQIADDNDRIPYAYSNGFIKVGSTVFALSPNSNKLINENRANKAADNIDRRAYYSSNYNNDYDSDDVNIVDVTDISDETEYDDANTVARYALNSNNANKNKPSTNSINTNKAEYYNDSNASKVRPAEDMFRIPVNNIVGNSDLNNMNSARLTARSQSSRAVQSHSNTLRPNTTSNNNINNINKYNNNNIPGNNYNNNVKINNALNADPNANKKKLTVAKSPNFSKLRWERKKEEFDQDYLREIAREAPHGRKEDLSAKYAHLLEKPRPTSTNATTTTTVSASTNATVNSKAIRGISSNSNNNTSHSNNNNNSNSKVNSRPSSSLSYGRASSAQRSNR